MKETRDRARWALALLASLLASVAGRTFAADWQAARSGLENLNIRTLAVDPVMPSRMYAGTGDGLSLSTDGGASWRRSSLSGAPVVAVAIDPFEPSTVYAAIAKVQWCFHSERRVFKSTDAGATWRSDTSPPINGCDNIHALATDPKDRGALYVANYDDFMGDTWSPLIKTRDGGASWTGLLGPPLAVLAVDPVNENTLYGGRFDAPYFGYYGWDDGYGVLRSTDGGVSWNRTGLASGAVSALAIDPVNATTLYAATCGAYTAPRGFRGLFKSTDAGARWTTIIDGLVHLQGTGSIVTAIVIDPNNRSLLYAATSGSGVFRSSDGGELWKAFNSGLSDLDVRTLALAPGAERTLYAGTAGSGVFRIKEQAPLLTVDSEYYAGCAWRVRIEGGAPGAAVRLLGTSNGRDWDIPEWGATDSSGGFSAEGVFPDSAEGNHTIRVAIDGLFSRAVSFTVSRRSAD
jgi:photosystem II stability/assembly factor-like uncharacterized protein